VPDLTGVGPWAVVLVLLTALAVGVISSLTPFLPAEAFIVSAGLTVSVPVAIGAAAAVAAGQTAGKVVLFLGVRRAGDSRWLDRFRRRGLTPGSREADLGPGAAQVEQVQVVREPGRVRRAVARLNAPGLALLAGRGGSSVVLCRGVVGMPPLLAVAGYAGVSTMTLRSFTVPCLVGRVARFSALVLLPGLF